jgi:hypothetical protein
VPPAPCGLRAHGDVEGERDDARRPSGALRVLVGRVLDEVRVWRRRARKSPFRRGPRDEKHFLVADLVTASRTRRLDVRNRRIEELLPGRPIYL